MNTSTFLALEKALMSRENRISQQALADMFQQMAQALEPYRHHLAAMAKVIAFTAVPEFRFQEEIARANQQLFKAFDGIRVDIPWAGDLAMAHASWMKNIQPVQEKVAYLQASAKLSLASSVRMAAIAEKMYAGIDFDKLQRTYRLQDDIAAQVQKHLAELAGRFNNLAQSVSTVPDLTALPAFVIPSASREVFLAQYVVGKLSPEEVRAEEPYESEVLSEIREETSGFVELLSRVNPALARTYQGAREARASKIPDRIRHFLVSLRELYDHLFRQLAPNDKVLAWVPSKADKFLHKGKPTRKTRLLYVCRGINHEPHSEFVNDDIKELLEMYDQFQRIHELEPGFTDEHLDDLLLRTESALTYVIQISEEGQEC